jgi:hypothetical protein
MLSLCHRSTRAGGWGVGAIASYALRYLAMPGRCERFLDYFEYRKGKGRYHLVEVGLTDAARTQKGGTAVEQTYSHGRRRERRMPRPLSPMTVN